MAATPPPLVIRIPKDEYVCTICPAVSVSGVDKCKCENETESYLALDERVMNGSATKKEIMFHTVLLLMQAMYDLAEEEKKYGVLRYVKLWTLNSEIKRLKTTYDRMKVHVGTRTLKLYEDMLYGE
jgi:hypothetical protein